ncbi:MAG TPA: hypothetical protein VFQ39_10510 [Longimicrobium sp.]|nr:hypothetical protein [Longimicrobium sp.]
MRKLTLKPEALRIESFDTGAAAGRDGTVRGHDSRITEFCPTWNCGGATRRSCPPCQIAAVDADQEPGL